MFANMMSAVCLLIVNKQLTSYKQKLPVVALECRFLMRINVISEVVVLTIIGSTKCSQIHIPLRLSL